MKTMLKRSMAILLILLMVISAFPLTAMAAGTISSSYLPVYLIASSETSSTIGLYYLPSGKKTYSTASASSSSSYYPWNPSENFLSEYVKTYKKNGYIPVDELKKELTYSGTNKNGIFQGDVYYRTSSSSNSSYTTSTVSAFGDSYAGSDKYTWTIYSDNKNGVAIPDQQAYISFVIQILNSRSNVVATKTVYVENPFLAEDYTIKYSITRTYDGSTTTAFNGKTWSSTDAEDTGDLKVVLSAVSGTAEDTYKFSSVGFNGTENYLNYDFENFTKLTRTLSKDEQKILDDAGADLLYTGTVTVSSVANHYIRVISGSYTGDKDKNLQDYATITFYLPVKLGYTDLLTIGDQVILKAIDPTDPSTYKWIGLDYSMSAAGKKISATYNLTSATSSSPQYAIKVVNNANTASTNYTVRVAESNQGTCSVTSFNTGTYEMKYYPELSGATKHVIKFEIYPNNDTNKITTLNYTIQFAGGATEAKFASNELSCTTTAGNSTTFELSSLISNFDKLSDEQKAQFTFTISDFNADTVSNDTSYSYGNYFVAYHGNYTSTTAPTKLTNDENNDRQPGSSSTVDSACFLDDYKVVYIANRNTTASDNHGFTVNLTNKTSDGTYTYNFKVSFTASEGAKPYISTATATLSAAAGKQSSSVYLKSYVGNFSTDLGLTYKVTSATSNYGKFYVAGSAASTGTTGSITASAPAIYYTANSGADSDKTDSMVVTVYQNSTAVGTITYTGKVGDSANCYTERQFNSAYPDDNAFAVVVSNTSSKSYSFKASDFANSAIDLTDDDYEDYYIEVITDPLGGELDGLNRSYEADVEDLGDLEYTRSAKTDTGIDCFEFRLYKPNSSRAVGTYTMWIVPNSDYLTNTTGYSEDDLKESYGTKSGFGVAVTSTSAYTFTAANFTNGTYALSTDYSDAYIEIVDEPVLGTLKKGSSTQEEGDRIAVSSLTSLKYTWDSYKSSNIDCFTFYIYKSESGSTKSLSTKFTMWIVGNRSLLSATSENWSATSTTFPTYKLTDVELDSDSVANVTLDADWVTEAVDTVKTGSEVTIAITGKSDAKGLSLTIDKSLFTLSNAAKISYITLSEGTTGASVSVSVADVLSAAGGSRDFTIVLKKLTVSSNSLVENALISSTATAARAVSFKAGSSSVTFDNVGAALLSIPYNNTSSYDDEMVVIVDYTKDQTPLVSSEYTGKYAMAYIYDDSQYLVAVNSVSFSDVSESWAWTRGYIPSLTARGTISGMGGQNAGKYMPEANLTRAEFIKLLVVSLGLENNSASNPFSDMTDHWGKQYVAAAVSAGIVSSGTTFNPDEAITRKDMALYAYKAAKAAGLTLSSSGSTTTFKDESELTGEYLTAVKAMQAAGIINGMAGQYEGYYMPNNGTDRASAAKIIWFLNAMLYGWSTSGKY